MLLTRCHYKNEDPVVQVNHALRLIFQGESLYFLIIQYCH